MKSSYFYFSCSYSAFQFYFSVIIFLFLSNKLADLTYNLFKALLADIF